MTNYLKIVLPHRDEGLGVDVSPDFQYHHHGCVVTHELLQAEQNYVLYCTSREECDREAAACNSFLRPRSLVYNIQ